MIGTKITHLNNSFFFIGRIFLKNPIIMIGRASDVNIKIRFCTIHQFHVRFGIELYRNGAKGRDGCSPMPKAFGTTARFPQRPFTELDTSLGKADSRFLRNGFLSSHCSSNPNIGRGGSAPFGSLLNHPRVTPVASIEIFPSQLLSGPF